MTILGHQEEIKEFKNRYPFVLVLFSVLFFLLFIRVWYLQVLKGQEHYKFSKQQSLRQQKIEAPRGIIFDRDGQTLVDNTPAFDIALIPQLIPRQQKKNTIDSIAKLLDLDSESIEAALEAAVGIKAPFEPIPILEDASRDQVALAETHFLNIPALEVLVGVKRQYLFQEIGAHVLGNLGIISEDELNDFRSKGFEKYDQNSYIGKTGLERILEDVVSGVDGAAFVAVDSRGYRREEQEKNIFGYLASKEALPGNNITLTIDQDLQNEAYKSLEGNMGSVVALNPSTGEVLAMISRPSFDPTIFSRGISPDQWDELRNDPFKPLKNKSFQEHYPPGSTYKVITGISALETGKVTPSVKYRCPGFFSYMRGLYRCWKKEGHGEVTFHKALGESCDVYFYNMGVLAEIDTLAHYADEFGLGKKTGIGFSLEEPGMIPTKKWKFSRFKERWYPGETVSNAIGQGYNTVTTLQLARLYAAIGNGGNLYKPYLVRKIENPLGNLIQEMQPTLDHKANVSPQSLENVKQGLWEAVNKPGGTAYYRSRIDGLDVCGKTGTAQVISIRPEDEGKKCEQVDYKFRDHALFAAFAPRNNPEIAVAAIVEHGCHGSSSAAPVVKAVLEAYFYKKKVLKERSTLGPKLQQQPILPEEEDL
ncbi:MAG: penicillin-binding protein 2 [Deltaproteobacteria bacterium]|nr:penicillin-binding protein 2 [Deltaproteobacteria bacterium]